MATEAATIPVPGSAVAQMVTLRDVTGRWVYVRLRFTGLWGERERGEEN